MEKKYERDLRRRRHEYERLAHGPRLQAMTADTRRRLFFRLPPRWRMRIRPLLIGVVMPAAAGLAVGALYAALLALRVAPLVLGMGVTAALWLIGAVGIVVRRRRTRGYVAPPRATGGGGYAGVREPRRPPPGPRASSVQLVPPVADEDPTPDATAGGTVLSA